MKPFPHADDLSFAKHLADIAAEVTLDQFGPRLPIHVKSDSTPVTQVDTAAEVAVRQAVAAQFPGDGVLGEEGGSHPGQNGRTWVIDPIDGTRLFAEGIPLWTTLICLRIDGKPSVAVADAPALNERYHATLRGGAFRNDQRIHASSVSELDSAFVLHAAIEEFARGSGVDALQRVIARARASQGIGDAWAHLLVARGAADVLVEQGPCFEWDWAATSLIVSEAGGALTRLEGGSPTSGCNLLVSNGELDTQVRNALYADGHAPDERSGPSS